MGFRFFRRLKLAPGISLNFSKSGISTSLGVPGARLTLGGRGVRGTVGIPGTGLYYTEELGRGGEGRRRGRGPRGRGPRSTAGSEPAAGLDLGFFDRLLMPKEEEHFVDGCKAYLEGQHDRALDYFRRLPDVADAAFLAGFLSIKRGEFAAARELLERAAGLDGELNRWFERHGIEIRVLLPVTEELRVAIVPSLEGALLGLAEALQLDGRCGEALEVLERLHSRCPQDLVVRVSIAELLLEQREVGQEERRRVVKLAGDLQNESEVHAALMLFKGRALRALGLEVAARDVLTAALRRRKDRSERLLLALRYERALVYEALGRTKQAREDLQRIYAADPDHSDVAARLGLG
jgi:tetratricopeptide (TPR) repeat protein